MTFPVCSPRWLKRKQCECVELDSLVFVVSDGDKLTGNDLYALHRNEALPQGNGMLCSFILLRPLQKHSPSVPNYTAFEDDLSACCFHNNTLRFWKTKEIVWNFLACVHYFCVQYVKAVCTEIQQLLLPTFEKVLSPAVILIHFTTS